jgi:hypothetical protein
MEQAGKFAKYLDIGVNLVSTPFKPHDASTSVQLQTLSFDRAWTYDAFDPADKWKSYATSKPYFGDLLTIDRRMGIWVNVLAAGYLTLAGTVPTVTSIQLGEGWNLVGYPSFTNDTITNALTGIAFDRIEGFDALDPYHLAALNSGDVMHTGEAFWIHLTTGATWDVTQ